MPGQAGQGTASLLARWLLLLGCGVGHRASPDTELLMQAPFAHYFNWTAAADLCHRGAKRNFRNRLYNIDCDDYDNIISLRVSPPNAANFTLPQGWGRLTHLESLALSPGAAGSLPPEWGRNGSFPRLTSLRLSNNALSGSLPAEWGSNGSFPQLRSLELSDNALSGSLPVGWGSNGSLPLLESLDLSNNTLGGSLPAGWGNNGSFPQLGSLVLYNNILNGSLPAGWGENGSFPQLGSLDLSNNGLSGSLPASWGNNGSFPQLGSLDLHNNTLTGSLPSGWGSSVSFPQLTDLWLDTNSLSGSLPADWGSNGSFRELEHLTLANNPLTGSLPAGWGSNGSFPHLKGVSIFNNSLSGSLPAGWGSNVSFPQLQELSLFNNSLSGTLPVEWGGNGSFPQLTSLWLYNNSLGGSLPAEWGSNVSFLQLQALVLDSNSLTGTLPVGWGSNGSFPMLRELYLHNNNLSGSLPVEWGAPEEFNIPTLRIVPATIEVLPFRSIKFVVLSNNPFTGGVPVDWTNNPHLLSGHVVLDKRLFTTSRDSSNFAKAICMDEYRYGGYRNWSVGLNTSDACNSLRNDDLDHFLEICLIPIGKSDLDPCLLDRTTKIVLISLWSCFALIVLLVCLEGRVVALMDRHVPGFSGSRVKAKKWIGKMLTGHHGVALGMVASTIPFWADIASDVPVLIESLQKGNSAYFYVLIVLMFGSHILDAILIARYAVAKGVKETESKQGPSTIFWLLPQHAAWFMLYFLFAVLALPALDVLGLVNPNRKQVTDSTFKVDLEGYQTMRLVIGAVFRTIPTAIVLTVIAALGNNPKNGTYFDATVVSVSLSLAALQTIVVIVQVRQRAAAQNKTKLQLVCSVFTVDGLALLSDGDPNQSSEDKAVEAGPIGAVDKQSDLKGPMCEGAGSFKPVDNEP